MNSLSTKLSGWSNLCEVLGAPPDEAIALQGGSISQAYLLHIRGEKFFLKCKSSRLPEFFQREKEGLDMLRKSCRLAISEVIAVGRDADMQWIVLEYVESVPASAPAWAELARGLAELHRSPATYFGLEKSNFIGELVQQNEPGADWESFFIRCRLMPLVSMASGYFSEEDNFRWERLYETLGTYGFTRKPALVHGDLWYGNVMFSASGPVLIDPAVYFGVPEMDIGMSRLFGGFDAAFYRAWLEEAKPDAGWQERTELCSLYPLLVHLNLFGSGYLSSVKQILYRYA